MVCFASKREGFRQSGPVSVTIGKSKDTKGVCRTRKAGSFFIEEQNRFSVSGLGDALRRIEAEFAGSQSEEVGVFVDGDGNEILRRTAAPETPFELHFTDTEIEGVASEGNATFTHNHPRGWQYPEENPLHAGHSFSPEDVLLACRAELREIRAVTPVYLYTMRAAQGVFLQTDWMVIEVVLQHEEQAIDSELLIAVARNEMTPEQYESELPHQIRLRVAAVLAMVYQRRERRMEGTSHEY
jgi:hypothetical protein